MMDYKRWYEKYGMKFEDELKVWINIMPDKLDPIELLGDIDDFMKNSLTDAYLLYTEENEFIDTQYEYSKEKVLLQGYCF